jgi:hypothetical protein
MKFRELEIVYLWNQIKEADPSTRFRMPDSAAYLAGASTTLFPSKITVST